LKQVFANELFNDPAFSKAYNQRTYTLNKLKTTLMEAGMTTEAVLDVEKATEEYQKCLLECYVTAISSIFKIG